jgi:hypothetical protein
MSSRIVRLRVGILRRWIKREKEIARREKGEEGEGFVVSAD